ncbi:MAG TPA: DUF5320 domain-containing protein [Dehalococcoidia bacterium]|nr:DUF5320 domain-containing protein [Dehalococcoidia bacterium]
MPGFDGTGPRGMGPMTGGGRGLCSSWGGGASFRRGIVQPYPRVPYAPYWGFGSMPYRSTAPWAAPFEPQITREQELDFLKKKAQATREQLEQIESRIKGLTAEE